ncbi:MAG: YfhO family protein [Candidatus Coatesbacteria bacterium]
MAPAPLIRRLTGRHPWGLAALALAAGIAVLQGAGGMPFFRDRLYYFLPQYDACRQALRAGEIPLWNPFANCGQPLLATWQVGLGSPFSLPFLLLPWERAVAAFWCLVLPFAAAGMYALGLRAGLTAFGAAVAAVVYAGAAPLRTLGEWPNIVAGLAMLPALLAAGTDLARGRRGAAAAVGLLATLQILAGQPRQALMAALTFGVWLLALTAGDGRRRRGLTVPLAAAGLVALSASAMQMLPTIELWLHSDRRAWGIPPSTVHESYLHASDAWTLVLARVWGTESPIHDPSRLLMPRLYFGWLGLGLAGLAAFAARGPAWGFALLALPAGLLVSTGGPLVEAALRFAGHEEPALRYLGHLILIAWPAVCLLVGLGAERLLGTERGRPGGWMAAVAAALAAVFWTPAGRWLAAAVAGTGTAAAGWLGAARTDAAVAAAAVVVAWLAARSRGPDWLRRGALVAAIAADLGWAAHAHEAKAPADAFPRPSVLDRFPLDRGRVFCPTWSHGVQVYDDSPERRALDGYQARWALLSPNLPQLFRLHNAHGYEPLRPEAIHELFGAFDNDFEPILPALKITGVRWILGPLPLMPPGWRVRARIAEVWGLMEAPASESPVRVVAPQAMGVPWRVLASMPAAGTAGITGETWNTLTLTVHARKAGLVTPTTPWYPGWRADVDGVRRAVGRAGSLFLAVPVPPGASRVRLAYVPLSFALGLFFSAVALGAVLGAGVGLPSHH